MSMNCTNLVKTVGWSEKLINWFTQFQEVQSLGAHASMWCSIFGSAAGRTPLAAVPEIVTHAGLKHIASA